MSPKETIDLALLALGNGKAEFDERCCECDPESGSVPCQYCAIRNGLHEGIAALARLELSEKDALTLRPRADGDGWTLMKDGLATAGGGLSHCLEVLNSILRHELLTDLVRIKIKIIRNLPTNEQSKVIRNAIP